MNLTKLFETQAKLDEHIMQEHQELRGQNNLDWKLLALQVELGECANEWRGFKKWSKDREPRISVKNSCDPCEGTGDINWPSSKLHLLDGNSGLEYEECEYCKGIGFDGYKNPLLEEYVDCLHLILSIGLELQVNFDAVYSPTHFIFGNDITKTFTHLIGDASLINSGFKEIEQEYSIYVNHFMHLGELLGFTWEQVEVAYYAKNEVNHERQNAGY
ncbi:dUTP diphosphatase [Lysinibacillus sp. NPDC086135]|uniref:dUTP diphosphatase n=1 Tax=Lysinibacillus sp. NPDC086135 TaxID=3364130 RepID=UPI003802B008